MANKHEEPDTKRKKGSVSFFDQFHDYKVCDIPATRPFRVDPMKAYQPKPEERFRIRDYNLTQAYTTMDRDPVKLHYTDTSCEYSFYPPGFNPSLIKRREHGRGPLDKELMEEFTEVINYYQYIAHVNLRRAKLIKARRERLEMERINARFAKTIGPDWFQELSKLQAKAVDDLANAIVKDLRHKSTEHTQYVIGRIGIVLRPNHCTVKSALKLCGSCPVEFLLVLYQLMNPDRTSYSANDRLLLSAVMHLTIRCTLRELHIRIPSPPREPIPKKIPRKTEPKPILSSPYMQELSRKNMTPQQNFNFPNKYYTSHDYFDYVQQLECERILLRTSPEGDTTRDFQYERLFSVGVCTCRSCTCPECNALKDVDEITRIELDLLTEWTKAQKYFTTLCKSDYIPALAKPSVYISPLGKFLPHGRSESISQLRSISRTMTRSRSLTRTFSQPKHSSVFFANETTVSNSRNSKSSKIIGKDNIVARGSDVTEGVSCLCKGIESKSETARLIAQLEDEYNCVCSIDEEGENTIDVVVPPPCTIRDYNVGRTLTVKTVESQTCACKEAILKRIEDSLCHCDRCVDDRRKANSIVKYIIADTKEVDDKPVPIIMDCKTKAICTCMEKYKKRWEKFEQQHGVRKVQEALKSLDEKFIINGTAVGPDGKIVYILSSVQPKQCCQCSKIKEFEKADKETLKKMPMLPGGCIKYHISGVQERPDGNVYVVAGTTENTECDCMQLYERFTREHQICMKLYNEYLKKIAYDVEEYMKDLDPSYGDFEAAATWTGSEVEVISKSCKCHADRTTQMTGSYCRCEDTSEDSQQSGQCLCSVESCPCGMDSCECVTEEGRSDDNSFFGLGECPCSLTNLLSIQEGIDHTTDNCSCSKFETSKTSKSNPLIQDNNVANVQVKLESKKLSGENDLDSSAVDLTNSSVDSLFEKIKESYKAHPLYKDEDPPQLDRFIIVKSLPRTESEQEIILKKALAKLAEDGFPLARLPEVHRLPIFRMWWRFRLGQYRSANYRNNLLNVTDRKLLNRMDKQRERPDELHNTFLADRPDLANWDHHDMIKKHNLALRGEFYRTDKVCSMNLARKLFTVMGTYEFPCKTFRDVFFAYMPSKDEDIMLDQIWQSSQYVERRNAKSCL